jgi:hypothetical protein
VDTNIDLAFEEVQSTGRVLLQECGRLVPIHFRNGEATTFEKRSAVY